MLALGCGCKVRKKHSARKRGLAETSLAFHARLIRWPTLPDLPKAAPQGILPASTQFSSGIAANFPDFTLLNLLF
jgi:hypothetical protein